MSTYQSLLREFVENPPNSQISLAAEIGTSQAAISRYANGARFPNADVARSIEQATGGAVPFSVWQQEMAVRVGLSPSQAPAA